MPWVPISVADLYPRPDQQLTRPRNAKMKLRQSRDRIGLTLKHLAHQEMIDDPARQYLQGQNPGKAWNGLELDPLGMVHRRTVLNT